MIAVYIAVVRSAWWYRLQLH